MDHLLALESINLQCLNIGSIDNLDFFTNCTKLSLSHVMHNLLQNKISELRGLDIMINLQRLYLSHNHLTIISSLLDLTKLSYLDVSFNQLADISVAMLPDSLTCILVIGNPVHDQSRLISKLEDRLPCLQYIDDKAIKRDAASKLSDDLIANLSSRLDSLFTGAKAPLALARRLQSTQQSTETNTDSYTRPADANDTEEFGDAPSKLAVKGANNLRASHRAEFDMAVLQYDTHMEVFKNRQALRKSKEGQR